MALKTSGKAACLLLSSSEIEINNKYNNNINKNSINFNINTVKLTITTQITTTITEMPKNDTLDALCDAITE